MCDRDAEHGHDRIADELLDGPPMPFDDLLHLPEIASQQRPQLLRVGRLAQPGRPPRSQKSAVKVLRCSREGAALTCSVPHSGQNRNGRSDSNPQIAQAGIRSV